MDRVLVSILVLVDAALRLLVVFQVPFYSPTCFNPCFSGCRPATHLRARCLVQ